MVERQAQEAKAAEAKESNEANGDNGDEKSDPARRVRRRRTATTKSTSDTANASPGQRPPRRDGDAPRKRRSRRPKADGNGRKQAVGASTGRRVYRQDVQVEAPPAPPTAEEVKAAKAKEAAEQNKITLLLHPPPKHLKRKRKKARHKTAKEALQAKAQQAAKSDKPKKSAKANQVQLQDEWLQATGDDAIAALLAGGEPLVKAWLNAPNAEAIVLCANSDKVSGKVRKAVRRAVSVLKSRGIELPQIATKKVVVSEEAEVPQASFIPPDASGVTFFSITQRQPGGRYRVADVMVRDQLGVVHASSGELPGKQIRKWKARVEERFGTQPIAVSLDWARFRIAEGRRMNDESKQVVPLGFDSCASLIEPAPQQAPSHPLADLLNGDVSDEQLGEVTTASKELHHEPEFANWLPDKSALDELLAKVGERIGMENASDQELINKVLDEEMAAAADRFFTPELRELLVSRMHDSAISLRHRKGDDAAKQVVVVAEAVKRAGLITSPPSEIPFLLTFFQKGVAYVMQQNQGRLQVPVPR